MSPYEVSEQEQSISVTGDVAGSPIFIGNGNEVSVQFRQASLPSSEVVNIHAELKAIEDILIRFDDPVVNGVAQKLAIEAQKPESDRNVVAKTLATGLTYIQDLSGFAETVDQLRPHVEATASWLGKHGYKLLSLVGLTL